MIGVQCTLHSMHCELFFDICSSSISNQNHCGRNLQPMTPREGGKKGELHRHTGELHRHSHLGRQVVLGSGSIRQLILFSHTFGAAAW